MAQRVLEQDGTGEGVVDGEPGDGGSIENGAVVHGTGPVGECRLGETGPADTETETVHGAGGAVSGFLRDIGGHGQREVPDACLADDRVGQHMRRDLVERGGQPKHLGRGAPGRGGDRQDARSARGQGAGLVDHQGARPAQPLQRPAVPDDDTATGRPRQSGDDGDRRGEQQRAGGRHDEDGDRAVG